MLAAPHLEVNDNYNVRLCAMTYVAQLLLRLYSSSMDVVSVFLESEIVILFGNLGLLHDALVLWDVSVHGRFVSRKESRHPRSGALVLRMVLELYRLAD